MVVFRQHCAKLGELFVLVLGKGRASTARISVAVAAVALAVTLAQLLQSSASSSLVIS